MISESDLTRRRLLRAAGMVGVGAALTAIGCGDWRMDRAGGRVMAGSRLARLRDALDGTLLLPADAGYDRARRVASFNPRTDQRPTLIVRCASTSDVARALEYARMEELTIAVRGGGHDVMGQSVCEGGVLIDMSSMHATQVSPHRSVARVQAGARAGQVNDALRSHGLAAALGCNPAVGVGGLTLGGGLGWLLGRFGASCDNLDAVELVTADGRLLRASKDEHPELFWGLRGGGGNFGIATAFEYRVHPLDRVVGGYLAYPGAQAGEFLRIYREHMADAPDELVVEVVLLASAEPPGHAPILLAIACWSGEPTQAERMLAPLRAVGTPIVDVVREVPYAALTDPPAELMRLIGGAPAGEGSEPSGSAGGGNYWQGASLSDWTDTKIETFLSCAASAPPGWTMGIGHHMHGELCRVPAHESCLVRRAGSTSYYFNMSWGDGERAAAAMQWVDQSLAAMRPLSDSVTYVNYLSATSEAAVAAAYAGNYRRLQALKRQFDPDNVFHLNRNIRPE